MASAFFSSSSASILFVLFFFFLICGGCTAATLGFAFHHRFSDPVRRWAESRAKNLPGGWPEKGTVEYYAILAGHDRGHALSAATPALTFSDGNATVQITSLGFLHYAMVSVGTPSLSFMVALDTGSDLFWVPCDCNSCAPAISGSFGNVSKSFLLLNQELPAGISELRQIEELDLRNPTTQTARESEFK